MYLTVVIPNFNGAMYLEEAILSALENSRGIDEFEIIVSDNHSTDNSKDIILKYVNRNVRLVVPDKQLSIGEHWTFVCSQATGKYVKFLGADDLQSSLLINEIETLSSHPRAVALVSRRQIIGGNGGVILRSRGISKTFALVSGDKLIQKTWESGTNLIGDPTAILFRKDSLIKALPWEDKPFPYVVDLSLYIKCFQGQEVLVSPKVVSSFRIHTSSVTGKTLSGQAKQFYGLFKLKEISDRPKDLFSILKMIQVFVMSYIKQFAKIVFIKLYVRKV